MSSTRRNSKAGGGEGGNYGRKKMEGNNEGPSKVGRGWNGTNLTKRGGWHASEEARIMGTWGGRRGGVVSWSVEMDGQGE